MYLRIEEDAFGFYSDEVHTIKESDVEVSQEDYEEFFKLQSEGTHFELKPSREGAKSLFDFVVGVLPKRTEIVAPTKETFEAEIRELRQMIDALQRKIEDQ